MANWYYAVERQQHGPVPEEQLRDLLTRGAVGSDCLVWTGGMAEWQKASAIKALVAAPAPPPPAPPPPAAPLLRDPALVAGTEDFKIGQVFRDALTALKTRLGTILLVSLVPNLLTCVLSGLFFMGFYASLGNMGTLLTLMGVFVLIGLPIIIVSFMFAQGVIAYSAFHNFCGRSVRFGEAMRQGLRRVLPLFGMGLLGIAAILAASVIKTVGGPLAALVLFVLSHIFVTILFVSIPACMVDKTGPIASMQRSASLTKGCRWKIWAIYLLTVLIILIGIIATIAVSAALAVGGPTIAGWLGGTTLLAALAVSYVLVVFFGPGFLIIAFMGVVVAATYANLRRAKEAVTAEDIAHVFD